MDIEIFKRILGRQKDTVFRLAYSNLQNKSDAEDVSQEVFLSLYTSNKTFETAEDEKAWLIRVTLNKCHDLRKSAWHRKRIPDYDFTMLTDRECDAKGGLIETNHKLVDEVMKLPLNYRNVIHLYYYEGYSVAEIAIMMNKNKSTIQTWLWRARKKLKENLDGKELIV